jgi:hypothetical protein
MDKFVPLATTSVQKGMTPIKSNMMESLIDPVKRALLKSSRKKLSRDPLAEYAYTKYCCVSLAFNA